MTIVYRWHQSLLLVAVFCALFCVALSPIRASALSCAAAGGDWCSQNAVACPAGSPTAYPSNDCITCCGPQAVRECPTGYSGTYPNCVHTITRSCRKIGGTACYAYGASCSSSSNLGPTYYNDGTLECGTCCGAGPACAATSGDACTSPPNSCGQTSTGTYSCAGVCSARSAPENPSDYGSACTSPENSCGQTNTGTIQCNGLCNAVTPPSSWCPTQSPIKITYPDGVVVLVNADSWLSSTNSYSSAATLMSAIYAASVGDGLTNASVDSSGRYIWVASNAGVWVNANYCVSYAGQACQSHANSCGARGNGTFSCGGVCNAIAPPESSCTPSSCIVSPSVDPIEFGSGTYLHYASSGDEGSWLYITNVGYVPGNTFGEIWVQPLSDTAYNGTLSGVNGSAYCTAEVHVAPPSRASATITADASTIQVGQSVGIHARFTAGEGDPIIHTNIDSPLGKGLGETTDPDMTKDVTFTPIEAGVYTFYARASTRYYSWTTYGDPVTVTVRGALPACTLSLSSQTIIRGTNGLLTWTSSNATNGRIDFLAQGSTTPEPLMTTAVDSTESTTADVAPAGSAAIRPDVSTTYLGTFYGSTGTAQCEATVNVECPSTYQCDGETIQYVSSSCAVANIGTCVEPSHCVQGQNACVVAPPDFGITGHLRARPVLVGRGDTTHLFWDVTNVDSCTVTGTNGDSWTGDSSGPIGKTTSPIDSQVIYTLTCNALPGAEPLTVSESITVLRPPQFIER